MNQQYAIDLEPEKNKLETFEIEDKNLVEVKVRLPEGKNIQGSKHKIEISLSPDAMLGLGINLIRKAIKLKKMDRDKYICAFEHLIPINKHEIITNMGVYLMPESAELMIAAYDFGKVENIVKKLKNEK